MWKSTVYVDSQVTWLYLCDSCTCFLNTICQCFFCCVSQEWLLLVCVSIEINWIAVPFATRTGISCRMIFKESDAMPVHRIPNSKHSIQTHQIRLLVLLVLTVKGNHINSIRNRTVACQLLVDLGNDLSLIYVNTWLVFLTIGTMIYESELIRTYKN